MVREGPDDVFSVNNGEVHFDSFKFNFHLSHHSEIHVRSDCKATLLLNEEATRKSFVSSANMQTLESN